jgi:hypothetical protein
MREFRLHIRRTHRGVSHLLLFNQSEAVSEINYVPLAQVYHNTVFKLPASLRQKHLMQYQVYTDSLTHVMARSEGDEKYRKCPAL